MSRCPNYRKATNAAYQLLVEKRSFSLSTNVFSIVEDLLDGCKLVTYGQACILYGYTEELLLEVSDLGFSIVNGRERIILYNETVPMGCVRFTIAHEIGHAVLEHSEEHDSASEREANCFARNLLCPLPVADGMEVSTAGDYAAVFDVSEDMAMVTLKWRGSDRYYASEELVNRLAEMLDAHMFGFPSVNEYTQFLAS